MTNIHTRVFNKSREDVSVILRTLSTENDNVWPSDKWPAMRFKDGFKVGSHGGHGPIQYIIRNLTPGEFIEFEFTKPEGFRGVRLTHFLRMRTSTLGGLQWILAIRWLHDALTEDAFDQIENQFSSKTKETEWSPWVKILRRIL